MLFSKNKLRLKINEDRLIVHYRAVTSHIWVVKWGKYTKDGNPMYHAHQFDHKPSITEIRDTIFDWYNNITNNEILSGFVWKDMSVWLSIENQLNYKTAYDLAIQSNGLYLPTFKFGTIDNPIFYTFKSISELRDFYAKMTMHINNALQRGWDIKNSIDWSTYRKLLEEYK